MEAFIISSGSRPQEPWGYPFTSKPCKPSYGQSQGNLNKKINVFTISNHFYILVDCISFLGSTGHLAGQTSHSQCRGSIEKLFAAQRAIANVTFGPNGIYTAQALHNLCSQQGWTVEQEVTRNPVTTLCVVTVSNKLHASTIHASLFYFLLLSNHFFSCICRSPSRSRPAWSIVVRSCAASFHLHCLASVIVGQQAEHQSLGWKVGWPSVPRILLPSQLLDTENLLVHNQIP